MLDARDKLGTTKTHRTISLHSHLSIQQRHRDVAVDMAPPGPQGGELHCGGRWEGRRHGGGLWWKLELVAAAEMSHLGSVASS